MDYFSEKRYTHGKRAAEWHVRITVNIRLMIWRKETLRRTKIICTLGPATDREDVLRKLVENGMDVARFNFSHASHEEHKSRLERLQAIRKEYGRPVAALLDTKGPEIRLKQFKNGRITLKKGQYFTLTTTDRMGDEEGVSVTFEGLPQDVKAGTTILVDDGLIEMQVVEKNRTDIRCLVKNGGDISDNKGVNVPDVELSMPFISKKDRSDILFAVQEGFDFIAASFTRTAKDILEVRQLLQEAGDTSIRIIAKIENMQGVDHIDEILDVADGIMVARGDLGVEVPFEEVPVIQKHLIKKCYNQGKVVITATQMLDSMIKNPRPTRAEATDVANAIYDGTSAIMLSGETAAGLYPVEALQTMVSIANRTEQDINYKERFRKMEAERDSGITGAISHSTCMTAHDLNAAAIVTVTKSGRTARMISKYRPDCPIIGGSTQESICRQLSLSWGVHPILLEEKKDTFELFGHAIRKAEEMGLLEKGDIAVLTAGLPLGISGTTNMLKVETV